MPNRFHRATLRHESLSLNFLAFLSVARCSYAAHERLPSTVAAPFVRPTTKLPRKLRERGRNEVSWNESIVGLPSFRGLTHGNYRSPPRSRLCNLVKVFENSKLPFRPFSLSNGTARSTSPVRSSNHDSIAKLSYSMARVRASECLARSTNVEV